jgi:hypothetical protein
MDKPKTTITYNQLPRETRDEIDKLIDHIGHFVGTDEETRVLIRWLGLVSRSASRKHMFA